MTTKIRRRRRRRFRIEITKVRRRRRRRRSKFEKGRKRLRKSPKLFLTLQNLKKHKNSLQKVHIEFSIIGSVNLSNLVSKSSKPKHSENYFLKILPLNLFYCKRRWSTPIIFFRPVKFNQFVLYNRQRF